MGRVISPELKDILRISFSHPMDNKMRLMKSHFFFFILWLFFLPGVFIILPSRPLIYSITALIHFCNPSHDTALRRSPVKRI